MDGSQTSPERNERTNPPKKVLNDRKSDKTERNRFKSDKNLPQLKETDPKAAFISILTPQNISFSEHHKRKKESPFQMIYAPFGDSHSVFWGNQQDFRNPVSLVSDTPRIHWMGPAKIWGLDNKTNNSTREKFSTFLDEMRSTPSLVPISSFGEIDIRVNIARLTLENRDLGIVDNLVDLYLKKLNELPNQEIIIWGPPPACTEEQSEYSADYPVFGSGVSRNSITHFFNLKILQRISNYPRIKFITPFYDFVNSDLETLDGVLHDPNHLSTKHFSYARALLAAVRGINRKAVLNYEKFRTIREINFHLEPLNNEWLGYCTNIYFYGPINFGHFCNLKFGNPLYRQFEVTLRPGKPTKADILPQIGTPAFIDLFFRGGSARELEDFDRYVSVINESGMNLFDTANPLRQVTMQFIESYKKSFLRTA